MHPSPDLPVQNAQEEPLIEVLDSIVPSELHAAAWSVCMGPGWQFGHGSKEAGHSRFWKMDLDANPTFRSVWEYVKPRCEELAGGTLRVIRQYANGHTYGLGGEPHLDDVKPGTFTFLYYPNPEWKNGWEGETVYYSGDGEIFCAIRPKPNRGIFFDSRIMHNGRAPARACTDLRVTVAFKLELVPDGPGPQRQDTAEPALQFHPEAEGNVFTAAVDSASLEAAVEARLARLAATVRLPEFRPGQIPRALLVERYGPQARDAVLRHFGGKVIEQALAVGLVPSTCELISDAPGTVQFRIEATRLRDLPEPDLSGHSLERLLLRDDEQMPAGGAAFLREHLKEQLLSALAGIYAFPLLPALIEREVAAVIALLEGESAWPSSAGREAALGECKAIAERRLRLAFVLRDMAGRLGISSEKNGEENFEDRVVDRLINLAPVRERRITALELKSLMEE